MDDRADTPSELTGDALLKLLDALSNPQRLRIVAALANGRNYVSQLARELEMSRPLLHLHLQKLEAAGAVRSTLELSEDGKAMRYFEVTPFSEVISAERIERAAASLGLHEEKKP
jgi:DNA-binding transcriptional ArsR family regulator